MSETKLSRSAALNDRFAASMVGRFFCVSERRTSLTQELRSGVVIFLASAYILAVNANLLADSGGPCSSEDCTGPDKSFNCRFTDPGYQACLDEVRIQFVTATAAASCIACFVMGTLGNMPIVVAPALGLNAYFTYNVVGYRGTGKVPYSTALTAIFLEGWIFIILAVTGVRGKLIHLLPKPLMHAMSAGIGLFLAHIGFQSSDGLGIVTADGATLVGLGGCPVEDWIPGYFMTGPETDQVCTIVNGTAVASGLPPPTANHLCLTGKMTAAWMWLGLSGLAIITVLMARGYRGSVLLGIVFVTVISWIPGSAVSYLGSGSTLPGGLGGNGSSRLAYFKKVVAAPSLSLIGGNLNFGNLSNGDAWLALVTFLYVDFFDCTATLYTLANYVGNWVPGFVNEEDRTFPRQLGAFLSDGTGIIVGSLMGLSPLTAYIDSAVGIREGGRTGITALVASFFFFVSLFFNPILSSIPSFATGPALIVVGALMLASAAKIDWYRVDIAVPCFITIAIMPLTYSIAYGVIGGLGAFIVVKVLMLAMDQIERLLGVKKAEPSVVLGHGEVDKTITLRDPQANADDTAHGKTAAQDAEPRDPKLAEV
ncbi:hypothetical protein WJX72_002621 [[Myrmecia] bisecta]|uniref:Xanthine/uracil permease n=1 Tax=[Myrmecia] bisecta TaxID=41462 RepID=A0AAW1PZN2_9CHLO